MSGPFATLNGVRITGGILTVPMFKTWSGDVVLMDPANLTADAMACTIELGNLTLVGTAHRYATFAGVTMARLVGGGGGWRKAVGSQHYQHDGGLPMSMLAGDAAGEVGERVNVDPDFDAGNDYVRENAAAEEVLSQLFGPTWWVDASGTTQLATRPTTTVRTPFEAIEWEGAAGRFTISTEDYAAWLPGAQFSGPTIPTKQTVSATSFVFDNDGAFRLDVLTSDGDGADRLISPIDAVIRASVPRQTYLGRYEYVIRGVHGSPPDVTADIEPAASFGLPPMNNIRLRASVLGGTGAPSNGTLCQVVFLNGDPTKPNIVSVDSVDDALVSASNTARLQAGGEAGVSGSSVTLAGGVYPATEHVATVEAVVNMFVNFVFMLNDMGAQSTWNTVFFNDPALSDFTTKLTTWLQNCALPSPPAGVAPSGPPTAGGMLLPLLIVGIADALESKIPDELGDTPSIGAPKVNAG